MDCSVGKGYWKVAHGSLPDVDLDFQADRRQEVKEYLERRYGHGKTQRVFSAGTFTTAKVKSAMKDIAAVYKIPRGTTNYVTAIINDELTWTGLMKMAATNKTVYDFIQKHPNVFEDMRPILEQPRSAGIHASACIIVPDVIKEQKIECFEVLPVRKQNDMLVSEIGGADIDELGILKNDLLGIAELARIKETLNIVKEEYNRSYSILQLIDDEHLKDSAVYDIISKGYTQGLFQLSSPGMTKFIKQLKPSNIEYLIAAVALFRPATLESGSVQKYIDIKNEDAFPEYLWGTENALSSTYSCLIYQEQLAQMAREVGGFSLGDGVKLVKLISKKKVDKIKAQKDKFMTGAAKKGCPKDAAEAIWAMMEAAGTYLFNKCISGKEVIRRTNRTHGTLTIAEMYKTKNDRKWAIEHGHKALHDRYNNKGYGKGWSLVQEEGYDSYLIKNDIVDIRYMGIRPLYRITLEDGATIDVTSNHKHPTNHGIKRTDELIVGVDKMYVNIGALSEDTVYRFTDKGKLKGNDEYYHSNEHIEKYTYNSQKGHCGFIKRETNYTLLEKYRKELMKDKCEICGATNCRLEIHHKNGDHSEVGDNFSNLQTLCCSCHKKAHYAMGRVKQGEKGLYTKLKKVISVEYIGDDEVYDVEMADPYHSFVTEKGVVTCNSHATAYALTSYVGAWLKTHYPVAFYTVQLKWVADEKLPTLMNEIEDLEGTELVQCNINLSSEVFVTDYKHGIIYWSLARVKYVGVKAVIQIVKERNMNGKYVSLRDFVVRIYKSKLKKNKYKGFTDDDCVEDGGRNAVTTRHLKQLIISGAFDEVEHITNPAQRYILLKGAARMLGFELNDKDAPEEMRDKPYYWQQKQIDITGFGAIDYNAIISKCEAVPSSISGTKRLNLKILSQTTLMPEKYVMCATIAEVVCKSYKDKKTGATKHYGKIVVRQNNYLGLLTIWGDAWEQCRDKFVGKVNRLVIAVVHTEWSDYDEQNVLKLNRNAFVCNPDEV